MNCRRSIIFPLGYLTKRGLEFLRDHFQTEEMNPNLLWFDQDAIFDTMIPGNNLSVKKLKSLGFTPVEPDDRSQDETNENTWWTLLGLPPEVEAEARKYIDRGDDVYFSDEMEP